MGGIDLVEFLACNLVLGVIIFRNYIVNFLGVKKMTSEQRKLARHALGFPNTLKTSYRNHYCIGKGGNGYGDWEAMVAAGEAVKHTGPHWGGDDMFYLTLKGGLAAREPKEHLSREETAFMRQLEVTA